MGACLFCGKQLGSLKRLSGPEQFCSEAHRLSYQAESNRLALERLQSTKGRRGRAATVSRPIETITEDRQNRSTAVLDLPMPEVVLRSAETVTFAGEDVVSQDKQSSRYRVAPEESTGPVFPVAPVIGPEEFLYAAGDDVEKLRPVAAPVLRFQTNALISSLDATGLETLGYDDPGVIEAARAEFGLDEGAYVPVEREPPAFARQPLTVEAPKPVAPQAAALMAGFSDTPRRSAPEVKPTAIAWEPSSLRSRMVHGKKPKALAPAPAAAAEPAKPIAAQAPSNVNTPVAKNPPKLAQPNMTVRPPVKPEPGTKQVPPKQETKPAVPPGAKIEPRPAAKAAPAPVKPEPEKPKVTVRPASPVIAPKREEPAEPQLRPIAAPARPAMAARGNALTVEEQPVEAVSPAAQKGKVVPAPQAETLSESRPNPIESFPRLGELPIEGGFFSTQPALKGGAIAAILAVILGGGYYLMGGKSKAAPRIAAVDTEATTDPAPVNSIIGGGGWTASWGATEAINKGKQISIYRPTAQLADYRMDFRGQIEKKAMGWIFRAKDPRNYYVQKLEVIRPGLEPVIALVKYAVIDGKESTRTQVMLAPGYKMDTVYRVRVDVSGSKFTTYVQDQLIDYWNDDRIKFGGAGLYNDRGERANVKTSQIAHLK